jgi:hypothetical protein
VVELRLTILPSGVTVGSSAAFATSNARHLRVPRGMIAPMEKFEPPAVLDEIVRRANEALASPDHGLSREEAIASARLAAQESRRRRS